MRYAFRWNERNQEHIAEHGVLPEEVEAMIPLARPPFPRELAKGKYLVRGQCSAGHSLQAILVVDPEGTVYVIHARPMSNSEKHQFRRSRR